MERKIGEIFEFGGEWYQCVSPRLSCAYCDMNKHTCYGVGACPKGLRTDGKEVVYKKLEKVGEPYAEGNSIVSERMFQKYRTYEKNFFLNERDLLFTSYGDIVSIEIKQNQENMEEKKNNLIEELDNLFRKHNIYISDSVCESMACEIGTWFAPQNNEEHSNSESIGKDLKPFDLEAAKSGKPVCTRDGRKARIICFDSINKGNYPIIALIEDKGYESLFYYNENGESNIGTDFNLMMPPEKHEGWVNIYKLKSPAYKDFPYACLLSPTKNGAISIMDSNDLPSSSVELFKNLLVDDVLKDNPLIATVRIEWEG